MPSLKNKTIIVTGSSRGIGREIALKCAAEGANLVIAAKTTEPHPKLPGTIHSVAEEVEKAGGQALAVMLDVRDEGSVREMLERTLRTFGGVDALINNAGAIMLTPTEQTPMKRFDLMYQVNVRAVFMCSQAVVPYLRKSDNAHIINLSPPISLKDKWLSSHIGYTLSKYGMSMCTLGMAKEFEKDGISVASVWPKTIIDTAAIEMLMGEMGKRHSRTPAIMADAIHAILTGAKLSFSGKCWLDEEILKTKGINDLSAYACAPGNPLQPDLFVE